MTTPLPPVPPPPQPPAPIGVNARLRLRRAWGVEWEKANPVLRDGEPGYDKSVNMLKIGDGETPWSGLPYITHPEKLSGGIVTGDASIDAAMASHIRSKTPHPVYDDGPSLVLLYQNAKV